MFKVRPQSQIPTYIEKPQAAEPLLNFGERRRTLAHFPGTRSAT